LAGQQKYTRISPHTSNVTAREMQYAAAFIYGLPEMFVEDVSFSKVAVPLSFT
jgi:hypothetical protein